MNGIPRPRASREVSLFVALLFAYVLVSNLGLETRWIFAGAGLVVAGFVWFTYRTGEETWRDFGLRVDNLASAALPIGLTTLIASLAIVIYAIASGASLWRSDLAILLPLYPAWGVVQQLMFQGFLHRRLRVLLRSSSGAVLLTAIFFALTHTGDARLIGLTLVAGLAWSALFVRWPNVWLLGASHGVLAALTYPLLLGDAPLERI